MEVIGTDTITQSQMTHTVISTMVGVGVLSLASGVVKDAHQDGWITILFGSIYQFYIALVVVLMAKRKPNDNILVLSRKYFGNVFGNLLNFIFSGFFMTYAIAISIGLCNVIRVFLVPFLSPKTILSVICLAIAYTTAKGLKVLTKTNQVVFYAAIGLYIIPSVAILKSNYLNVCPVFGSGFSNIFKATTTSMYAYAGTEIVLLIYPFLNNKKKLRSSVLKGVIFVTFIYTWFTFLNIIYLGPDMISKYMWPFIPVMDSLNIPVVTNFRFIFLFLWVLFIYKTGTNHYFATVFILEDIYKSINFKIRKFNNIKTIDISYLLYPLVFYFALKIGDEVTRRAFLDYMIPKYTLYVLAYPTIILILSYLIKDDKYEKI